MTVRLSSRVLPCFALTLFIGALTGLFILSPSWPSCPAIDKVGCAWRKTQLNRVEEEDSPRLSLIIGSVRKNFKKYAMLLRVWNSEGIGVVWLQTKKACNCFLGTLSLKKRKKIASMGGCLSVRIHGKRTESDWDVA